MTTHPGASKVPAVALLVFVSLAAGRVGAGEDGEAGLSLSDLAAYRAALGARSSAGPAAVPVTFRELWGHAERYQGRRVRVEGRVVRRFRQGAVGTFPPLAEVWAVSPAGDPFCLVFPAPSPLPAVVADGPAPAPGASVRFEGMFLRRLRYQGGDTARLAPLIVGDRPPTVTAPAPPKAPGNALAPVPRGTDRAWADWTLGLVAASFVALALARHHLYGPRRRPPRSRVDDGPAPEFVEDA